jgi:ActR/RegA family two-component response regulator
MTDAATSSLATERSLLIVEDDKAFLRVLLTVISHSPETVRQALEAVPQRRAAVG